MGAVNQGMWSARIEGDFVVFLIGARLDKLHPVRSLRDLGGMRGMPHMLKYLTEHPEKGLLGYQSFGFTNVQYWRSFEHLERFARDDADPHLATKPSTATCRRSASARPPSWSGSAPAPRRASGSAGTSPADPAVGSGTAWHESLRGRDRADRDLRVGAGADAGGRRAGGSGRRGGPS